MTTGTQTDRERRQGPSVEDRLARLEDARAIEFLKYRYAEICDTGYHPEGFRSLFAADGRWSANGFGSYSGIDAICAFFSGLSETVLQATHFVTSPRIVVAEDGLTAVGAFYLLCFSRSRSRSDPGVTDFVMTLGTYRDTFRKDGPRWVFSEIEVAVHHAAKLPHADRGADGVPSV